MSKTPEPRPERDDEPLADDDQVEDDQVDEMERESFPASDPPSGWAGPRDPR